MVWHLASIPFTNPRHTAESACGKLLPSDLSIDRLPFHFKPGKYLLIPPHDSFLQLWFKLELLCLIHHDLIMPVLFLLQYPVIDIYLAIRRPLAYNSIQVKPGLLFCKQHGERLCLWIVGLIPNWTDAESFKTSFQQKTSRSFSQNPFYD